MGSPKNEQHRLDDEEQVTVTLGRGFWLGKCEVTQGEYRQVMHENPSFFPLEGRDAALAASVDVDEMVNERASDRVFRGGSWYDSARDWGSARLGGSPDIRSSRLGFRVALVQSREPSQDKPSR